MKNTIKTIILFLSISFLFFACTKRMEKNVKPNSEKPVYDSTLANQYGADDYGMKKYVIAFLKRGPNRSLDSAKRAELQLAHLNNIIRMSDEGLLVLAGPFFGNDDLRGIYVFDVDNLADAEKLTNSDPAVQAGSLVMELKEWYGSAALVGLNKLHEKIQKKGITD